jgi:quinol monooxygenase YgiN
MKMVNMIIRQKVKNYDQWKPIFIEHDKVRKSYGEKSSRIFRGIENPNELMILFDWESKQKADDFMNNSNVREIMETAGIMEEPQVFIKSEV